MTELNPYEIEDRILASLERRGGAVTAGDVAADTGLPYDDVEQGLRRMLSAYKSHLDVDDDGNLRYRFDPGFVRRGEEPGRLWHDIKDYAWTAFTWVFKVWIMVTLVGYTVIFLLLLLALAIASIAAATASEGDVDIDGDFIGLPFYFFARTLEVLFWISLFDDSSAGRGRRGRGRRGRRRRKPKPDKAFYQKVFDFVFGPEKKVDALEAQKTFTRFVRHRKGVVSAAEWSSRSGQSLGQAENALTAGLMRFNGDVAVSENGSLLYRFDALRVTADESIPQADVPPIWTKRKVLEPFTKNPSSSNWWIGVLNTFNLIMASVVLFVLPAEQAIDPAITIGLGWVPLVFSTIFFAVPLARRVGRTFEAKAVEKENERREELAKIFKSARDGRAADLDPAWSDRMILDFDGEIEVDDDAQMKFTFETVARELHDAREARDDADEVVFGATVFSSDEDEKSLEETELEEFDRRLAIELGVGETVAA